MVVTTVTQVTYHSEHLVRPDGGPDRALRDCEGELSASSSIALVRVLTVTQRKLIREPALTACVTVYRPVPSFSSDVLPGGRNAAL
jgi:hypothetical protein